MLVGVALLALVPTAAPAVDDRLLPFRLPVLLDGTGQVIGPALLPSNFEQVVRVWLRIGARDLLLTATQSTLGPDPEFPVGRVAFGEPGCAGSPWFEPLGFPFPLVFAPVALGPGNTLFTPDGPAEFVVLNSSWNPSAPNPCQAEGGGIFQLQRAVGILDLGSFPPPFTVR